MAGTRSRGSRSGAARRSRLALVAIALVVAVTAPGTATATVARAPVRATAGDLRFGSYLGGGDDECSDLGSSCPTDIALGPDGSIFVVGSTGSDDLPTTPGAYDRVGGTATCPVGPNCTDAFVARFDPTGSTLIYLTYLGGSGSDCRIGCGVAVDADGAAFVTGGTDSRDFPTTLGAADRTCGTDGTCNAGALDGFVAKLSPDGAKLRYATFLGGSDDDWGRHVVVGPNGAATVVGAAYSEDFPTTPGAFDRSFNGGFVDAFVTKLTPAGSGFAYSTYVGGKLGDLGVDLTLHAGTVYAVGYTNSFDFPTSADAYERSANGSYDAFVVRLSGTGSALLFGTYLGGSGVECLDGCSVAVRKGGDPVVAGATHSSDFPTTPDAFDTAFGGGSWCGCDGFVTELNPNATTLVSSTFLGGTGSDFVHDVAIGPSGAATVIVETDSTDLPTPHGAFQRRFGGGFSDAFVATLSQDGGALTDATYLGGKGSDCLGDCALAFGPGGAVYVAGDNRDKHFPTTDGSFQPTSNGGIDAFVAALSFGTDPGRPT